MEWLILSLQVTRWPQLSPSPHFFASNSYVSKDREAPTCLCRRVVLPKFFKKIIIIIFNHFLLFFEYSCLHFPTTTFPRCTNYLNSWQWAYTIALSFVNQKFSLQTVNIIKITKTNRMEMSCISPFLYQMQFSNWKYRVYVTSWAPIRQWWTLSYFAYSHFKEA